MSLLSSLEAAGLDLKKQGKPGEYLTVCPRCTKLKLAINVDKEVFQCWTCGQGGGISDLAKWLGITLSVKTAENFGRLRSLYTESKSDTSPPKDKDCRLPKEYAPLTGELGVIGKRALKFVLDRGVTPEMIEKWGLGYCSSGKYANMIVIPVEDTDGNIRMFQTRRFGGIGKKNNNPPEVDKVIYNLRHAAGYPGIVIVEGPWDAMAVHTRMAGYNISAIALLGHACSQILARQIAQFLKPEYVWIALDPDVTEQERENVAYALMAEGLQNVSICHPETDPDELSREQIIKVLETATKPIRRRIMNV